MSRAVFTLSVTPQGDRPLFAQIATSVVDAIRRGRLAPGARLPGSRALARTLDVHRNTVLAAYDELSAQGWIQGAQGKGTFVSRALPEPRARRTAAVSVGVPERAPYALAPAPVTIPGPAVLPRGALSLAGGVPDLRLAPVEELSRAYRRAVRGLDRSVLDYGSERGHPRLREALAALVNAARGLAATPDDVLVTRGSQMGFFLAARAIVEPGSVVAVEAFGYAPAWDAFRAAGARLVPIAVDEQGLRVDELETLLAAHPIRAVYTTPHHQYPTVVSLSADRRLALLDLARRHRFAIVEDDYDNEIHFHGRPVLPLASADPAGVVVYVGTLSKVLAPGVRVGYVVAPRSVLDRMALIRRSVDRQGDPAVEHAVAQLLEDDVIPRHARRMRRVYQERRDHLVLELRARLGQVLSFDVPTGGLALWSKVDPDVDVEQWSARALAAGVYFRPPAAFAFDGRSRPFARFSYAPLTPREIELAVKRLASTLPHKRGR